MNPDDGVSPWRNAKPRRPIDSYPNSPERRNPAKHPGESPPNSGYKESTRMGQSFDKSTLSLHDSSQLELSGASPALTRSEERSVSQKRTSKATSFTKVRPGVKNTSRTRQVKAKYSDNELSEDDQPSGSCHFVGEHSSVTNISSASTMMRESRASLNLTPPQASKGSSVCKCVWVTTVLCLAVMGVALVRDPDWDTSSLLPPTEQLHSSAEHWKQVRRSVSAEVSSLKIQFPNQTKTFWRVVAATLKSPLHPLPDYPGVLLLVSPPAQSSLSTCLASKLLEISSRALLSPGSPPPPSSSLLIRAADLSSLHPDTAKRQLTEALHSSLESWATAGLLDLASLHPTAALTLHAFADNSNAPYKQAVLVLTLNGDLESEEAGGCKLETRVERLLGDQWREGLGVDKFSALVSRVVVSVAELQPESQQVCG